jgi:hypothetical protein
MPQHVKFLHNYDWNVQWVTYDSGHRVPALIFRTRSAAGASVNVQPIELMKPHVKQIVTIHGVIYSLERQVEWPPVDRTVFEHFKWIIPFATQSCVKWIPSERMGGALPGFVASVPVPSDSDILNTIKQPVVPPHEPTDSEKKFTQAFRRTLLTKQVDEDKWAELVQKYLADVPEGMLDDLRNDL